MFTPLNVVRNDQPGPTHFAIDGDRVEITRSDQPICRVPLEDLLDFAAQQKRGAESIKS